MAKEQESDKPERYALLYDRYGECGDRRVSFIVTETEDGDADFVPLSDLVIVYCGTASKVIRYDSIEEALKYAKRPLGPNDRISVVPVDQGPHQIGRVWYGDPVHTLQRIVTIDYKAVEDYDFEEALQLVAAPFPASTFE